MCRSHRIGDSHYEEAVDYIQSLGVNTCGTIDDEESMTNDLIVNSDVMLVVFKNDRACFHDRHREIMYALSQGKRVSLLYQLVESSIGTGWNMYNFDFDHCDVIHFGKRCTNDILDHIELLVLKAKKTEEQASKSLKKGSSAFWDEISMPHDFRERGERGEGVIVRPDSGNYDNNPVKVKVTDYGYYTYVIDDDGTQRRVKMKETKDEINEDDFLLLI